MRVAFINTDTPAIRHTSTKAGVPLTARIRQMGGKCHHHSSWIPLETKQVHLAKEVPVSTYFGNRRLRKVVKVPLSGSRHEQQLDHFRMPPGRGQGERRKLVLFFEFPVSTRLEKPFRHLSVTLGGSRLHSRN